MARLCRYCDKFNKAKVVIKKTEDKSIKIIQCPESQTKDKQITRETVACTKGFVLSNYLWCSKREEQIHMDLCASRRRKGSADCDKCRQKEEIVDARRGFRPPKSPLEPQTSCTRVIRVEKEQK